MHEAFCRLMRLRRRPDNLKAYAFQCVRNAAVDLVRHDARADPLDEDSIFDPAQGPRAAARERELQDRVQEALGTLSADERETIVQHLWGDLAFREIAEVRERSLGTVTSWYRRGLAKLRERLEA